MVSTQPPEKDDDTYRGAAAEFIGLILFQFFGGLAAAGAPGNGVVSTPDIVVSVLLWYLTLGSSPSPQVLAVLIYCTAAISGGHLNPAVSLALCITKQIP